MAGTEQENRIPPTGRRRSGDSTLAWLAVGCSLTGLLGVVFVDINSHNLLTVLGFSFGLALLAIGAGLAAMVRGWRPSQPTFQLAAVALLVGLATATLVVYVIAVLASTGD